MKTKKIDVLIDFDNTVADTSKAVLRLWCNDKNFSFNKMNYTADILQWNFEPFNKFTGEYNIFTNEQTDLIPYFSNSNLYSIKFKKIYLEPFYDIYRVLNNPVYRKYYNFILCTKRKPKEFKMAVRWCKKWNLKFDKYVRCNSFDKSSIGNKNSIIIDDKIECLGGANRSLKILFGKYGYQSEDFKKYSPSINKLIYNENTTDLNNFINNADLCLHCYDWNIVDAVLNKYLNEINRGI